MADYLLHAFSSLRNVKTCSSKQLSEYSDRKANTADLQES